MSSNLRVRLGAMAAIAIAATTFVVASPASSQVITPVISLQPTGDAWVQTGSGSLDATLDTACDSVPTADDVTLMLNGETVAPESVTIIDESHFTIVIPAGHAPTVANAGSQVEVSITCDINAAPQTQTGFSAYAEIAVTKAVTGDAPAGAMYTIAAACTPSAAPTVANSMRPTDLPPDEDVQFEIAAGSTVSIFTFRAYACTLSETVTNGALTTTIEPGTVTTEEPIMYTALVTNTFGTTPKFTG